MNTILINENFGNYNNTLEYKVGILQKAKTGSGRLIQTIGFILWIGCGLLMFVWTLYVLFSTFGAWMIFVGLLFAPITYIASIFIIWFSTDTFPFILLTPYIASYLGIGMIVAGGTIAGDDYS